MPEDTFADAVAEVLAHEGGYVDDPDDPGGETNFGISRRFLNQVGAGDLSIRELSQSRAVAIYREYFWDPYPVLEELVPALAVKVFDAMVNMGPAWGFRLLQRSLRACGAEGLVDDAVVGPATRKALREHGSRPAPLLAAFRAEMAGRYRELAGRRDQSRKYLKGWLRRAYS